jgi:hypothetical protein
MKSILQCNKQILRRQRHGLRSEESLVFAGTLPSFLIKDKTGDKKSKMGRT